MSKPRYTVSMSKVAGRVAARTPSATRVPLRRAAVRCGRPNNLRARSETRTACPMPPVAGVDDQVADRPGSILDEHVLHVADVPVCRPNAILPHGVGASQVMIVMLMALRLRLLQIGRPHDLTPDHAA